jgi:hypothetical protein
VAGYKAKQIARIRDAVAAARRALREAERFEPLLFGEVFVANEGIQLPRRVDDELARQRVGAALLRALRLGGSSEDADVARELARAEQESAWAKYAVSDRVVGFRLQLGPRSEQNPNCQALLKEAASGLGPGVFGKYDVVVLHPECRDCRFEAVFEHDLEW